MPGLQSYKSMKLQFLTFRELLRHRALALRALRRGRNTDDTKQLIEKINSELKRRRDPFITKLRFIFEFITLT